MLKYKKNDEDESLKDKLSKLNIHSISKKSKRVTNHLKILTRGESQVGSLTPAPREGGRCHFGKALLCVTRAMSAALRLRGLALCVSPCVLSR